MPAPERRRSFLDEALPKSVQVEILAALLLLAACYVIGIAGWNGHRRTANSTEFWPFYNDTWFPGPVWTLRVLLPLGVFAAMWPLWRRWLCDERDGLATLLALVIRAWAFHLALGFVRHGVELGLNFTFRRPQEYWNDVRYVSAGFLARFPDVGGRLSQHGATHPPGPTLFLALLQWLGFTTPQDAELACTPIAALTALPLYGAARRLTDETSARMAAALFLFAGSVAAFAMLSMDVLTMLLGALALYGAARALDGERLGGVLLGVALAAASLCNFIALTLPLTFGALWLAHKNARERRATIALAVAVGSFFAAYAILWLGFGYRPVLVFQRCLVELSHSDDAGRPRLPSIPRGAFAYLLALGLPFAGMVLHTLGGAIQRARRPLSPDDRRTALMVAGAALPWLVAVLAGKPRGETEHVFLLFVPTTALCTAVAARRFFDRSPRAIADVAVPLLALQAVALEIFYETYW